MCHRDRPARRSAGRGRSPPSAPAPRLRVTRVDEDPPKPGIEPVVVAQRGQLAPGRDQGLLDGVLGSIDVAQDPERDRHQPIADRTCEIGERFLIPSSGQVHECLLHSPSSFVCVRPGRSAPMSATGTDNGSIFGYDPGQAPGHDRVPEGAESLDPEDDLVAGLEIAAERRVADLEQAARCRPCRCRSGRPGRSRTSADARASISPNENCASDQRPRLVSVPLTSAVIARS